MRKALLHADYAVLGLDAPTHGDTIAENGYALVNDLHDGREMALAHIVDPFAPNGRDQF